MTLRWHRQHYPLVAVAAPMAVWALHFLVVYSLVGLGCEHGWHLRRIAGSPMLTWTLVLVTAVALALIAWLGWHARRRWRALRNDGAPAGAQPRERFMRLATGLLALLAFIAVLFTATPIFMLPPCA